MAFRSIMDAYYPDVVRLAGAARDRARNSFSIVATVASVALAVFTGTALPSRGPVSIALGIGAALLWLLAAGLFLHAAAGSLGPLPPSGSVPSAADLSRQIIDRARNEARTVERRIARSLRVSAVALTVTGATFASYALGADPTSRVGVGVLLGIDEEGSTCSQPDIRGRVLLSAGSPLPANEVLQVVTSDSVIQFVPVSDVAAVCTEG